MQMILLSGGSGTRLWPLSNHARSRQFLRLLKNHDGAYCSMLQHMYAQLRESGLQGEITIAASEVQTESIKNQLKETVDLVIEPERRNTFPAVMLSCAYLKWEKHCDDNETILVIPVDTYAEESYALALKEMADAVEQESANLILMGIQPTYPSAKYGYALLQQSDCDEHSSRISRYIEKPDEKQAEELIRQGALWNGGVFGFKLGYMMSKMHRYLKAEKYTDVLEQFGSLPKISFDYEITEKETNVATVRYHGAWKDLGTWNTLTEEMKEDIIGLGKVTETCSNTHVVNELGIPIVAVGLSNVVVAASPDGILVSDKHQSSYLKPIVEPLEKRPMFEERRWGEYRVLDYTTYNDGIKSLTKHLTMAPGEHISYQSHAERDEIWTIADGTGWVVLDDVVREVSRGDVIRIKRREKHAVKANSLLHIIEVQIGTYLEECDITRYAWEWDEI